MPFRGAYKSGVFTPEELKVLESAYHECCLMLDVDPFENPDKDEIASQIVRHFSAGVTDPSRIAENFLANIQAVAALSKPRVRLR